MEELKKTVESIGDQFYQMVLHVRAMTDLLIKNNVIDKDELELSMVKLHNKFAKLVEETGEETAEEA